MRVASFQLDSPRRYRLNAVDVDRDADLMTIYRRASHMVVQPSTDRPKTFSSQKKK